MVRSSKKRRDRCASGTDSGTEPDAVQAAPKKKQPKSDTQQRGVRNIGTCAVLCEDILVEQFHMNPVDILGEGEVIETMLLEVFEQRETLVKELVPHDQEVFDHLHKEGKIQEAITVLRARQAKRQAKKEVSPSPPATASSRPTRSISSLSFWFC